VWLAASLVLLILKSPSDRPAESQSAISSAQAQEGFTKLSASEHLRAAEQLITEKASLDQVNLGKRHLSVISAGGPEFTKVDPMLKEADVLLKKLDKEAQAAKAKASIDANPLVVVKSTWHKGGFDNIALWTVTFRNKSDKPVGNITYRTEYSSETGQVVDHGGVDSVVGQPILKVIPPGSSRTVEINDGFLHHEAHRASFELVGWAFVLDQR